MIDFFLHNIEKTAESQDLTKLEQMIHQLLSILIIPKVEIIPGMELQRIRNNYHGEIFYSESEISFRSDIWNIKDFADVTFLTLLSSIPHYHLNILKK